MQFCVVCLPGSIIMLTVCLHVDKEHLLTVTFLSFFIFLQRVSLLFLYYADSCLTIISLRECNMYVSLL